MSESEQIAVNNESQSQTIAGFRPGEVLTYFCDIQIERIDPYTPTPDDMLVD